MDPPSRQDTRSGAGAGPSWMLWGSFSFLRGPRRSFTTLGARKRVFGTVVEDVAVDTRLARLACGHHFSRVRESQKRVL